MFEYKEKNKGFSLIGVIATLFIAAVGLASVISLTSISLNSSNSSKMKLVASGLAQEGIEIVRDIRRANADETNWSNWYSAILNGDYRVQYNIENLISFSDAPLKIDAQGYYQYDSGDDSPFYRKVSFDKLSANELKLSVEIKWKLRGQWFYLTVEDRLWNWK